MTQSRLALFGPLQTFTRAVNRLFAAIASVLVFAAMLLISTDVVCRYALNAPIEWAMDTSTFMLIFIFFLAIAPALESGSHIEVDLFDPLIPRLLRKPVRVLGKLITIVFACVLMWFVSKHFKDVVENDELSFSMVIIPLKWVHWIGPVGAAQFLLTALVDIARFIATPLDHDEQRAIVH
jgi:TRAP-type C4-dicarboxylate transport system permease small subunit